MKCVCYIPSEGVCRVTDFEAAKLVGHGEKGEQGWKYVAKADWKDTGKMTTVEQAVAYVEKPEPKKTVKAATVVKSAGAVIGDEIEIVKKPKFKKGVSKKK